MATPGSESVGWTEQRWKAVKDAVEKTLAGTAKCRQVIPKGPEMIGEKAVVAAVVLPGVVPITYGPDAIHTPIQVFVDSNLDDPHAESDAEVVALVEIAAAQLGVVEDLEIVQGPPAPAVAGAAGAAAAAAAAAAAPPGRVARNPALVRRAARAPALPAAPVRPPTPIGAAGANPNGAQLYAAITTAVAALEGAGRPGRFGLLVHNTLMATLRQPRVPGGVPLIQEVEGLIGSSEIVGTSALDGTFVVGQICAVLLRLEPPAMDLVHTQLPRVTILGRAAGQTNLRVEEEIVLRVLDPTAIQPIAY